MLVLDPPHGRRAGGRHYQPVRFRMGPAAEALIGLAAASRLPAQGFTGPRA